MKKLLALAVVLALLAALPAALAASGFTDDRDIANTEAASMLTSLKVIEGFPDGRFRPAADVTRGQLAKMIYYVKNGVTDKSEDKSADYSGAAFSDISGHWSRGYVSYCTENGIIAGYTDGTFKPDKNVTAAEAAKMLLVALGYDPKEYVGTAWFDNTVRDAEEAGITKGYSQAMSLTLDRDDAALFIYNALFADIRGDDKEENLLQSSYGATKSVVTVTANEWAALEGQPCESGCTRVLDHGSGKSMLLEQRSALTDLGRTFAVYPAQEKDNGAFTVYGGLFRTKDEVVFADTSRNTVSSDVVGAGKVFTGYASDAKFYSNYSTRIDREQFVSLTSMRSDNKAIYISGDGDTLADIMIYISNQVMQIKDISGGKVTFEGQNTPLELDRIVTELELKAGALYTVTNVGRYWLLEGASEVTGSLERAANGSVTVGAATYELSLNTKNVALADGMALPPSALTSGDSVGKTVRLILNDCGQVVGVVVAGEGTRPIYGLVISSGKTQKGDSVLFFTETDGAVSVTADASASREPGLYSCTAINSDGTVFELKKAGEKVADGTKLSIAKEQSLIYGLGGYIATEKTSFFFWSGSSSDEPAVYRGIGQVPSVNVTVGNGTAVWYAASGTELDAVYISESDPGITSGVGYIYIFNTEPVEWSSTEVPGSNLYTYEGWSDGSVIRLRCSRSSIGSGLYAYRTHNGISEITPIGSANCVRAKIGDVYSGFVFLEGGVSPSSIHNWKSAVICRVDVSGGTARTVTELTAGEDAIFIFDRKDDNTADAAYIFIGSGVRLGQ